jgi:hypothetical protein
LRPACSVVTLGDPRLDATELLVLEHLKVHDLDFDIVWTGAYICLELMGLSLRGSDPRLQDFTQSGDGFPKRGRRHTSRVRPREDIPLMVHRWVIVHRHGFGS